MTIGGERRVALAAVAGAHGVGGEIRLKLFSEDVKSIAAYQKLFVGGVERQLLAIRAAGKMAIARLSGVTDRAAAEALRGSLVEVSRSALPPLAEGEYYHADLLGLPVVDQEANPIGEVSGVENYGAGDLLEIETGEGKRQLVPFKPGIADFDQGVVVIDPDFLA